MGTMTWSEWKAGVWRCTSDIVKTFQWWHQPSPFIVFRVTSNQLAFFLHKPSLNMYTNAPESIS